MLFKQNVRGYIAVRCSRRVRGYDYGVVVVAGSYGLMVVGVVALNKPELER